MPSLRVAVCFFLYQFRAPVDPAPPTPLHAAFINLSSTRRSSPLFPFALPRLAHFLHICLSSSLISVPINFSVGCFCLLSPPSFNHSRNPSFFTPGDKNSVAYFYFFFFQMDGALSPFSLTAVKSEITDFL